MVQYSDNSMDSEPKMEHGMVSQSNLVSLCGRGLVVGVGWTSGGRGLTRRRWLPIGACRLVHVRINHIGIWKNGGQSVTHRETHTPYKNIPVACLMFGALFQD